MNSTQLKSRQLNQNINILLGTHVTRLAIPESGLGLQYRYATVRTLRVQKDIGI